MLRLKTQTKQERTTTECMEKKCGQKSHTPSISACTLVTVSTSDSFWPLGFLSRLPHLLSLSASRTPLPIFGRPHFAKRLFAPAGRPLLKSIRLIKAIKSSSRPLGPSIFSFSALPPFPETVPILPVSHVPACASYSSCLSSACAPRSCGLCSSYCCCHFRAFLSSCHSCSFCSSCRCCFCSSCCFCSRASPSARHFYRCFCSRAGLSSRPLYRLSSSRCNRLCS